MVTLPADIPDLWDVKMDSSPTDCAPSRFSPEGSHEPIVNFIKQLTKPGFDPSDAVDFWDLVNRQDWAICAGVQNGIRSRVHIQGFYAPMEDWNLDIRRYVTDRIGAFVNVRPS